MTSNTSLKDQIILKVNSLGHELGEWIGEDDKRGYAVCKICGCMASYRDGKMKGARVFKPCSGQPPSWIEPPTSDDIQ